MEWLVIELTTYFSSVVHVVVSFIAWLGVIVFTAMVLVYNRLAKQVEELLHLRSDPESEKDTH